MIIDTNIQFNLTKKFISGYLEETMTMMMVAMKTLMKRKTKGIDAENFDEDCF